MKFSHTFWVSDNTDPLYRLGAQWNYSTFLPAIAATCHVTHSGDFKPKFRFDVSMMGQLGLEIDPRRSEPEFQAAAKTGVAAYKQIREIVQFGDQFRHASPSTPRRRRSTTSPRTRPAPSSSPINSAEINTTTTPVSGLDPAKTYEFTEINLPAGRRAITHRAPGTPHETGPRLDGGRHLPGLHPPPRQRGAGAHRMRGRVRPSFRAQGPRMTFSRTYLRVLVATGIVTVMLSAPVPFSAMCTPGENVASFAPMLKVSGHSTKFGATSTLSARFLFSDASARGNVKMRFVPMLDWRRALDPAKSGKDRRLARIR